MQYFIIICEFKLELWSRNSWIGFWLLWHWPLNLTFCKDITSVIGHQFSGIIEWTWKCCLENGFKVVYKVIVVYMLRDQIHGCWILAYRRCSWSYVWRLYKNQFVETGSPLLNILPAVRYHSYVNSSVIRDMNRQHSKQIWKCRRDLYCGHGSIPIICR